VLDSLAFGNQRLLFISKNTETVIPLDMIDLVNEVHPITVLASHLHEDFRKLQGRQTSHEASANDTTQAEFNLISVAPDLGSAGGKGRHVWLAVVGIPYELLSLETLIFSLV
jgi:hypothetical protein